MQSPNLADENTLNVLPHLLLHRSDTVLPKTAKPSTEQSAPKRAKFLTLIALPSVKASRIEHVLDPVTFPRTDMDDPRLTPPLNESELPRDTKANTLSSAPNREAQRILTAEPIKQ
jgi:hypothetical protein